MNTQKNNAVNLPVTSDSGVLVNQEQIKSLQTLMEHVRSYEIIKPDDFKFLEEKKEHLAQVFDYVYIWRTDNQKESIISDNYHPTLHSKFHQAICEQKVQLDQAFYLAKDYEMKKLDAEEQMIEYEELLEKQDAATSGSFEWKKLEVQRKRLEISMQFHAYELKQLEIQMNYRMKEVKGWQNIEERLIEQMRAEGMDEQSIWDKQQGEIEDMFFMFLSQLRGVEKSTDGAEYHNLLTLAKFGIDQAKKAGIFYDLVKRCDMNQLGALVFLGEAKVVQDEVTKQQKIVIPAPPMEVTPKDSQGGK